MKIKQFGCEELVAQFRSLAKKVPDNARKVMHRETDKIVERARLFAPRDDGELEQAIHKVIGYEGRGRLKIDIEVGGIVNGVNVDRYAALIHENYESMTPGPGTVAKRAANPGVRIGSKFLTRAIKESMPKLNKALITSMIADMKTLED